MHASGQYIQQIRHLVHFSISIIGRNVLHDPVLPVLATRGLDSGVRGRSLIFCGAFAIGCHPIRVRVSIKSEVKVFRMLPEVPELPVFDQSFKG